LHVRSGEIYRVGQAVSWPGAGRSSRRDRGSRLVVRRRVDRFSHYHWTATLNKKTHTVSALELHCALSTEHPKCTQHSVQILSTHMHSALSAGWPDRHLHSVPQTY